MEFIIITEEPLCRHNVKLISFEKHQRITHSGADTMRISVKVQQSMTYYVYYVHKEMAVQNILYNKIHRLAEFRTKLYRQVLACHGCALDRCKFLLPQNSPLVPHHLVTLTQLSVLKSDQTVADLAKTD